MNYEEKYNQMVQRCRELHESGNALTKQQMEIVCPELRESEDERNIDTIFNCLYQCCDTGFISGTQRDNALAYLEKQNNCLACDQHLKGYIAGRKATEEEKQKEQKPAQTVDEKEYIRTIKGIIADFIRDKQPEDVAFYQKIYDWLDGRHIEQKPVESISQPTVQGKGVYKICPRCKERMVRDDSKVYTSMPPQYGYICPKCGTMEFDTVVYDSPEMEEQKPVESFRAWCEKKGISLYDLYPQAEWSEEDEDKVDDICKLIEHATIIPRSGDDDTGIPPTRLNDKYKGELKAFVKSIRNRPTKSDTWKPSEEQMEALNAINCHGALSYVDQQEHLISLYNDIKKL